MEKKEPEAPIYLLLIRKANGTPAETEVYTHGGIALCRYKNLVRELATTKHAIGLYQIDPNLKATLLGKFKA